MVARLQRSADFERVLQTRSRASSPHFAVHHASAPPGKFSTGVAASPADVVDDSRNHALEKVRGGIWLGSVVPKRHARRAVTRSLLKRLIRAAVAEGADAMAAGCWVVRLRAPIDRAQFPSASSCALRSMAQAELQQLVGRVATA